MNHQPITSLRIVSDSLATHSFDKVVSFRIDAGRGMLTLILPDGEFGFNMDRLRYYRVERALDGAPDDSQQKDYKVILKAPEAGGTPETLNLSNVTRDAWDVNIGLLTVIGKTFTLVFHLDHVVQIKKIS